MKRNLFSVTLGFVSKTIFLIVGSFLLLAIISSLLQLNSTMGEETITIEVISIKSVEHKAIRDDLTFLTQLGVIEASSPEYKSFFQALTGTTNSSR